MAGASSGPSLETVVSQAFITASNIILEARNPLLKAAKVETGRRAWFNIEVAEDLSAQTTLSRWRKDVGLPLVLEIFLQPWGARDPLAAADQSARVETLLERWVLHYHSQLPDSPSGLSRSALLRLNPSAVYKRLVIMLRSLYSYLRVLPAYRMYRAAKRQHGSNFSIGYRIHSTLPSRGGGAAAAASGARRMQSFAFTPVDTPYGQFRLGVDFQPASTVTILEQTTSPPPLPQIIADYVGSPMGGAAAPIGAAAAGHPPLRHAMSASVFAGGGGATAGANAPSAGLTLASPPGARHMQRLSSTPPVRRSWSTAMRGLSPNRLGPVPGYEPASPPLPSGGAAAAAAAVPSGSSAPQQGAVFGPAVQRSLSGPGRAAPGSPSAKPPLARPPRARGCSGAETPCNGDASPAGPPSQAGAPTSYQPSAPVLIPGPQARRLRSSGDLWAMQQAANMQKPLSAPAVTHMRRATPEGGGGSGSAQRAGAGRQDSLPREPSLPPTPLPVIPGTLESESSGSAASSHMFPTSCSPQLPFAFTPSGQLGASSGRSAAGPLGESLRLERTSPGRRRSSGGGSGALGSAGGAALPGAAQQHGRAGAGGGAGGGPAGLTRTSGGSASSASGGGSARASPRAGATNAGEVAGREVSASLALARRPSWFAVLRASQSGFSSDAGGALALNGAGGAALSVGGVGYSVSPMADPTLEALLAGSTPRRYSGALVPHVGSSGVAVTAGGSAPAPAPAGRAGGASGLGLAGEEPDALPFALDGDSSAQGKPISPALPASASHGPSPSATFRPAGAPAEAEQPSSDAVVGAFVRLLQDAPCALYAGSATAPAAPDVEVAEVALPSQEHAAIPALTLQAGLERLSLMRQRLAERGVSLPPSVQVP